MLSGYSFDQASGGQLGQIGQFWGLPVVAAPAGMLPPDMTAGRGKLIVLSGPGVIIEPTAGWISHQMFLADIRRQVREGILAAHPWIKL